MKITYAITVKDELVQLDRLLNVLYEHKRDQDEIVIIFDSKNGSHYVEEYLRAKSVSESKYRWYPYEFNGHFADLKNYMNSQCTGDFIFQIDADEYPNKKLMEYLPVILEHKQYEDIDVFVVPRINTVEGITEAHIEKWGWWMNQNGWVNFPDYQFRIYRNSPEIKWINKVHERLDGFKKFSAFPKEESFSLYHPKDIDRQEKQNSYYSTL